MLSQVQISYENMGASSYLAAAFSPQAGLVNYQLEMLAANEISHFLPVTKRVMNGETVAYYNISSKIALSQIMSRRKLSKMELVQILKGFLSAAGDGEQYQLPAGGIVMEADYIFVDPSTMEPSFVYLPVSVPQEKGVKELVLSFVMEGKIELTGDNFVQLLLEAVNKQPFRLEDLKQVLDQVQGMPQRAKSPVQGFSGTQGNINMGAAGGFPQSASIPGSQPVPSVQTAQVSQAAVPVQPAMPVQQVPPVQPARPVSAPASGAPSDSSLPPAPENKKGKFGKPSLKGSKKEKTKEKTKPVKESAAVEEDGFDPEKAKKKFLLPQAVVMVAVAALVSFGAFTDEYGDIAVTNILAVVLILAVTEVILYREAYVNSRKKGNKKTDKKAVQKNSGKKPAAPGKPSGFGNAGAKPAAPSGFGNAGSRPAVPSQSGFGNAGAKPAAPSGFNNAGSRPAAPVQPAQQQVQQPVSGFQTPPVPQQSISQPPFSQPPVQPAPMPQNPITPSYAAMSMSSGSGDETELWDGTQGGMSAYLEYYENGQLTRIPLDKPSVLVGRLKGQVDFAVANPKVGKVHAEFINQDGLIYVKDLNSKNGTYINGNGQRIGNNMPYPLSNNDRVTLADSEFTVRCGS